MKRAFKFIGMGLGGVIAIIVIGAGTLYALGGAQLRRTYPRPAVSVAVPATAEAVARGRHLVEAVGSCMECHGEDLGGQAMEMGPIGTPVASNLTRGAGGVGATLTDADWVHAIRHGLRRDGTSLVMMPSEAYVHFTDEDLGAIIAYLKQLPPVDRELPRTKVGVLGRALMAAGKMPLLAAEHTPALAERATVNAGATAEYGRYLAGASGCIGCHGPELTGGIAGGPPGTPPSANLTPASLGSWTEADFFRLMREGVRPDGRKISDFMPWRYMGRMSDDELRALWRYLQSVPAQETPVTQ